MATRDSIKNKMDKEYPDIREPDEAPPHTILRLFHANENLHQAQINFIIKKIHYARNDLFRGSDITDLKSNKKYLRKLFIENNKVVKENLSSTYRFLEKMKENAQEKISLSQQIKQTKKELTKYPNELKKEMENKVQEYTDTYVTFLKRLVQSTPEFNSVQNVLNWYETLENCREDCKKLLKQELEEASQLKQDLLTLTEEKSVVMRKLQNSLVMLKVRRKLATEHRAQWENIISRLKDVMSIKTFDSMAIQTSCYVLYCEMCRRRNKKPTVVEEDIKGQLQYIENSIVFFKEVNRIATATRHIQDHQELKFGKLVDTRGIMNQLGLQTSELDRSLKAKVADIHKK